MLLQFFVFLPLSSLAADPGKTPTTPNHKKTKVTKAEKAGVIKTYGKLPLYFIENKGQVDMQVSFYERGAGHASFFTSKGVVLGLTKKNVKVDKTAHRDKIKALEVNKNKDREVTTEAVSLTFIGANAKAKIIAGDKKTGHVNYFVGNDKSKWRSDIPTYGTITYKDVYKDIDIKFYGNNRRLEHDIIVHPGGDLSKVKFAYSGIKGLKVTEDGDLEVTLNNGRLIEQKPVIYQKIDGRRLAVEGAYRLLGKKDGAFGYGFDVASYDHAKKIVIDPLLVYSTYLGGSGGDDNYGIAVDASGNAYVAGDTTSTDFPLMNPLQGVFSGGVDLFVTKLNPAGTALVYSTYLGGTGYDNGYGIAVDSSGNAYITGDTTSTDFPLMNPLQGVFSGRYDRFVTKLNPAGTALVYSTYLGGTGYDEGRGIAVDSSGNAYIGGNTTSTDFPLMNPLQGTFGGQWDAFITKINPAGTALVYSTYLGGTNNEFGYGIAVDLSGNVYMAGETDSTDFPLMNPVQTAFGGGVGDAFITKINPAGTALVYSTYLGGTNNDSSQGIAVNSSGNAYVTGWTNSIDFPLMSPIQGTFGGFGEAFITKLNPAGSALAYSTYLGGSGNNIGNGIAVDSSGNAYVTGSTTSTDFPIMNPVQATFGGFRDVFITKINSTGSAYIYSTYLGGTDSDTGRAIALDGSGNAYVTGRTHSTDFPLMNPIQATYGGLSDAFVTKIRDLAVLPIITVAVSYDAITVPRGGSLPYRVTVTNTTNIDQCFYYWENFTLPNGATYPPNGGYVGPIHLCINGGSAITAILQHYVPYYAPVGAYIFNALVGDTQIIDSAHFNFNVTAFGPVTNHPATSRRLRKNALKR